MFVIHSIESIWVDDERMGTSSHLSKNLWALYLLTWSSILFCHVILRNLAITLNSSAISSCALLFADWRILFARTVFWWSCLPFYNLLLWLTMSTTGTSLLVSRILLALGISRDWFTAFLEIFLIFTGGKLMGSRSLTSTVWRRSLFLLLAMFIPLKIWRLLWP